MTASPSRRGAALLEFAMALPFALTLFLGIGDFSVFFWRQMQMEDTARLAVSRIHPNRPGFAAAAPEDFRRFASLLEQDLRLTANLPNLTVRLTRHYTCPFADGTEPPLSDLPTNCRNERVYLRLAASDPVDPILGPLRWAGFPKATFSHHFIRLR
jgi:hypothetical protein